MAETSIVLSGATKDLEPGRAQALLSQFSSFLEEAGKWEADAKAIVVTDESQADLMKRARTARLALKSIRVNVENTRKSLKENIVREGKAIDGISNAIKALIEPLEDHLQDQEEFAERAKVKREQMLREARQADMAALDVSFVSVDLGKISENDFIVLRDTALKMKQEKEAAEAKLEEERVARLKAEAEEKERVRLENELLKKEAEERERLLAEERREASEKQRALEAELAKTRAQEQKRLEEQKQAEAEKVQLEQAQKSAPDKDKLTAFAESIRSLQMPSCQTEEARDIADRVKVALGKMADNIDKAVSEL